MAPRDRVSEGGRAASAAGSRSLSGSEAGTLIERPGRDALWSQAALECESWFWLSLAVWA